MNQPQTSKTSESTASLTLAERWTITEIRQSNSLMTLIPCSQISFRYKVENKTRMRECELIKFLLIVKVYFPANKMNWM